jgi:phosphoribosylanthranilate isomerase
MVKLKVCGMRDVANIQAVAELRPDYMGFIFYKQSPRYVGDQFSIGDVNVRKVGVFVNENTEKILAQLKSIGSTTAQLHGDENPVQCAELKGQGITVIKVFPVDDDFNFEKTKEYENVSDFFLFDTKGKLHGGNAKVFNWRKLQEYDQSVPFFLSGGLNADNLKDIGVLKDMNLHALDLNSGVEDSPGLKNISKISDLMKLIQYQIPNIQH